MAAKGERFRRILLAAMLVAILSSMKSGVVQAESAPMTKAEFPLWKSVPTHAFATLGKGTLHGTEWAVYAFSGAHDGKGSAGPCLVVAHFTRDGRYGSSAACGPLAPALGLDVAPAYTLFGSSYRQHVHGRLIGETFFGMSLATTVRSVSISVEPGQAIVRRTRLLSPTQAAKAHLAQFRYIALSVPRDICVDHIVAEDFLGNTVIDADGGECPLID